MRMLQHGNLSQMQQSAALAAVRAGGAGPPGPSGAVSGAPGSAQQENGPQLPPPPPPEEAHPTKYKVEYMPLRREVRTHGGWDLDLVEAELGPLAKGYGKQPRTIRELGVVDIAALILSLRSRLETEVSYALNSLLILSSGSGTRPDTFSLKLVHCGDLLQELLELLEESAFLTDDDDDEEEQSKPAPSLFKLEGSTHRDWVADVLIEEEKPRLSRRGERHQRSRSLPQAKTDGAAPAEETEGDARASVEVAEKPSALLSGDEYRATVREDRQLTRRANTALTILDILRNFAIMPENADYLAKNKDLLILLGDLGARAGDYHSPRPVFTPAESLRVKKDVLFIVSSITGPSLRLSRLSAVTVAQLFDLFCSFILDGGSIEKLAGLLFTDAPPPPGVPPHLAPRQPPIPWAPRVPHYADMALDGFARFAQPDGNRKVLSKLLPEETVLQLALQLVRMLPCSELDFNLFRTEARLSYTEHIAMCLYDIVFLAPAKTKLKLRSTVGWVGTIFRVVKRTSKQGGQAANFTQNPFSCLIYRLIETLKLIDDARDMFNQPKLMSFSSDDVGGGASGASPEGESMASGASSKRRAPLLASDESEVFNLLAMPGLDPVLVGHLSGMISA